MEQVYQFNLDNYIQYYDYDLCEERSDYEYSDNEDNENHKKGFNDVFDNAATAETENPFGSSERSSSLKEKNASLGKY